MSWVGCLNRVGGVPTLFLCGLALLLYRLGWFKILTVWAVDVAGTLKAFSLFALHVSRKLLHL
jgi:hypothetical protein